MKTSYFDWLACLIYIKRKIIVNIKSPHKYFTVGKNVPAKCYPQDIHILKVQNFKYLVSIVLSNFYIKKWVMTVSIDNY